MVHLLPTRNKEPRRSGVDIVVKGRNVEVPIHYRMHVAEKLQKIERYDHKIITVDVELSHERNPRQADICQQVEITCVSRGPVVRAEACAADFYGALDAAIAKLDTRLRRAADRRRVHRARHAPISVAEATAAARGLRCGQPSRRSRRWPSRSVNTRTYEEDNQPWHVVRMKEHPAEPMTVDDALFQMELVGHDFYLFLDKDSGRASVVYRRRGLRLWRDSAWLTPSSACAAGGAPRTRSPTRGSWARVHPGGHGGQDPRYRSRISTEPGRTGRRRSGCGPGRVGARVGSPPGRNRLVPAPAASRRSPARCPRSARAIPTKSERPPRRPDRPPAWRSPWPRHRGSTL